MAQAQSQSFPRRHVLCFDGTGNSFQAQPSDTNIVKLYEMLDRDAIDQFHYYQRKFPQVGSEPTTDRIFMS